MTNFSFYYIGSIWKDVDLTLAKATITLNIKLLKLTAKILLQFL